MVNNKTRAQSALDQEINDIVAWTNRPSDFWNVKLIQEVGEKLLYWLNERKENIWFKSFLHSYGITSSTCSRLYKEFPLFVQYYDCAKSIQEQKLLEQSLQKRVDAKVATFILTNRHEDWKEKVSVEMDVNINSFASILSTVSQQQSRLPQLTQDAMTTIEATVTPMLNDTQATANALDQTMNYEATQVLTGDGGVEKSNDDV